VKKKGPILRDEITHVPETAAAVETESTNCEIRCETNIPLPAITQTQTKTETIHQTPRSNTADLFALNSSQTHHMF
jgi:hypothetical protein